MQPTDHMSTAVEYSCGDTNKHSGSPQKTQSRRVCLKSFTAGAGHACESGRAAGPPSSANYTL